ncbi:MAG: GTPase HflX [Gemmatimonadaceae bacterium]
MSREIIELTPPTERAILIGAPRKGRAARQRTAEHLEELERLADTAGATVVGEVVQQIDRPNSATYIGKGKVEELKDKIADTDATLLLFDDELSPSQGKNIEDMTGKRVMDRAELILDIFATRARSSEAKMQVELAQLQYMLPRLTRMWAHLEKFRGGIGVRDPGETQLETDRRLIGHRIKVLGQRLEDVQRSREVQRGSRRGEFQASLVGYTNAGKSSILRALAADDSIFVENRLFATLDPLTREIDLGEGDRILLTDTVGFVRKLPHQLVASFRATLEEVVEADVLLHVIDVSDPMWEDHRNVVVEVLAELGAGEKPVTYVFNKSDLLPPEELEAVRERVTNLVPGAVFVSAAEPDGLEPLKRALTRAVRGSLRVVELRIPVSDGRTLAELYRDGDVIGQRLDGDEMVVRARLTPEVAGRVEHRLAGLAAR